MAIRSLSAALVLGAACFLLGSTPAQASRSGSARVCSAVASTQAQACQADIRDNLFEAQALCINGPEEARRDCQREAQQEFKDAADECGNQRDARDELCDALGEGRYAPDFDPGSFTQTFASPNPYFPLSVGDHWKFVLTNGDGATDDIDVLDATKRIEGVTCAVVHDVVKDDAGRPTEDTQDWIAQRNDGGLDYCGEMTETLGYFPGDDPVAPERLDIEGSWKTGVDGALPGTLFPATPTVGAVYRQEWLPGTAEDAAEVVSTTYTFGNDATLDDHVPAALAQLLCTQQHPCVVTKEFSPLEPDTFERKYYAQGIGQWLGVTPDTGEVDRLTACNVDPRCASLPQP
ncbi:MAG TPA: hypothetical protein VMS55_11730 [Myxococcota bacterium]|nr:hypothetical protein [Myxococcota bacterium]